MLLTKLVVFLGLSIGVLATPMEPGVERTEHGLVKKCPCCRSDGSLITRADADEWYDTGC
jgi:hypothetical protein